MRSSRKRNYVANIKVESGMLLQLKCNYKSELLITANVGPIINCFVSIGYVHVILQSYGTYPSPIKVKYLTR